MAVSYWLLRRKSAPRNLRTNFRFDQRQIHACMQACMHACIHAHALPSKARHARSEATTLVTANCT